MRHRKKRSRFGKMDDHRKFIVSSLAKHLLIHQEIETTHVRAKEARRLAERLITIAKENNLNARRRVFAILRDNAVVKRLFEKIMPLFASRAGGYTRIIHLGVRRGDGAQRVILELVEKVKEDKPAKKKAAKEKKPKTETVDKKEHAKDEAVDKHKSAPEVKQSEKEERTVEDVKKERFKNEDRRAQADEKKGFFKKFFRRKAGM